MIDLTGKVVLITGAGRGIGEAIARTVVRLGGAAVIHDVSATESLSRLHAELGNDNCLSTTGDLADGTSVHRVWREALEWRGHIDVMVNNAGIYESANVEDAFELWAASWHRTFEINLFAPGHFCREAIRHFREQGGGVIINIASRAAFRGDEADYMHYAASKAGMVAMSRTIARHFGKQNITVFTIAPGFVRTALNSVFFETCGVDNAAEETALGEIAEPQDIANTVVFLASGLAKHATGAVIDINGASYVR